MLGYQEAILSEALEEDGLTVLGRGLGLHSILLQLIRIYSKVGTRPAVPAAEGGPRQALVFVLNVGKEQQEQLQEDLSAVSGVLPIRFVNQEVGVAERAAVYLEGGCVIATAPILIVDSLNGRVNAKHVSGLIVNDAHRVSDTSREAFIVRLFRTTNQTGFVKAFSESADLFSGEFGKVSKVLASLYLRKLFLWPRFHLTVAESIARHNPEVIELSQPTSPLMGAIQRAVLDTMEACLGELLDTHGGDLGSLSVEDGMGRAFDKSVRTQLRSVWNKVGRKTKQLVSDLGTLQRLLEYLFVYDCVTFLAYLEMLRSTEGRACIWLGIDAASKIFHHAERRVYKFVRPAGSRGAAKRGRGKGKGRGAKRARVRAAAQGADGAAEMKLQLTLEGNPKWGLLMEVLAEIETAQQQQAQQAQQQGAAAAAGAAQPWLGSDVEPPPPVLVIGADERTCTQLEEVLAAEQQTERYLERQFSRYVLKKAAAQGWQTGAKAAKADGKQGGDKAAGASKPGAAAVAAGDQDAGAADDGKGKPEGGQEQKKPAGQKEGGGAEEVSAEVLKQRRERSLLYTEARRLARHHGGVLDSDGHGAAGAADEEEAEADGSSADFEVQFGVYASPHVLLHALGTRWRSERLLESVRPLYVVMYDPDAAFVRCLEVFKANNPGRPLRVYFLTYANSVEEQRYRTSVRREKEAFESLIKEKASMVLPSDPASLAAEAHSQAAAAAVAAFGSAPRDSRAGGARALAAAAAGREQVVIVDTREFRSSLPSILHARNMRLVPVTLEVGDYILSPNIAVERKSIPDLFGSFASGRLYSQADAMCRHYKVAVLLIEFDESKPFALQLTGANSRDSVKQDDLTSKLAVLLMHFPTLRLLWMRSPQAAADIFAALKAQEPQPHADTAAAIGQTQGDGEFKSSEYNWAPQEVLRRLPGVNQSNIYAVMRSVTNLAELAAQEEAALQKLLGKANGTKLYEFLRARAPQAL